MLTRLLALLLVVTAPLLAESSVWKVTRGGNTLYLGGTIHLLRPSDFPLPREFDTAFAASTRLVFETDVARVQSPEMQAVIARHGMFGDGTTLEQVLTPKAWLAAREYCTRAGLPVAQLKRMKPWLFTLMLAALELQKIGISSEGVDLHLFNQAREARKTTGELETFDRHIQYLVTLGAGHESEMIEKSLEELDEIPRIIDELIAAWRTGSENKIDELLVREVRQKYPAVFKSLLADRNAAWVPKLDALLKTPEVEFVLVGAGHLPGPEGVLALLKARGCRIEQVKAAAAAKTVSPSNSPP